MRHHSGGTAPVRCRMCGADRPHPAGRVRNYPFVECGACGFAFTPALTAADAEALYRANHHGPGDGVPAEGWPCGDFLAPALARLPQDRPLRILDYGTGQSRVPDLLRGRGNRVIAVDLAPPLRPHPDRLTGPLDSLGLARGAFDLVYAFQVFEHLPEPRPVLDRLLALARPGGLLLVHTDMETPERTDDLGSWWYATPPDHCSFYRPRTFAAAVRGTPHQLVWHDAKTALLRAGAP